MLLLLALHLACAVTFEEEDAVLVLTDKNFKEAIGTYRHIVVEFYAPWCVHCQQLAPHYAKAAQTLRDKGVNVPLAKLNAEANIKTADRYEIEGFPTIRFFEEGQWSEYSGRKDADSIVHWVLKRVGPAASVLTSEAALQSVLTQEPLAVVLYAEEDSKEAQTFKTVAKSLEGLYYYIYPQPGPAKLIVHKQYDDFAVEYTKDFSEYELTVFIRKNQLRWVLPFEDRARYYIFRNKNPCLFLFRQETEHAHYEALLQDVAKQVQGSIFITYVDLGEDSNKRLAEFLGVDPTQMPLAFIFQPNDSNHMLRGPFDTATLVSFIRSWEQGTLKEFLKTDQLPQEEFDQGVKVLVGSSFTEVVGDRSKDVLVEFYAPWCGHCQALAPEYAQVAAAFAGVDSVVVAKMDATSNEVPGVTIRGFPTIILYPANVKDGVEYSGDRSAASIIEFVHTHTAIPIKREDL